MNSAQNILDYQRNVALTQKQIQDMVLDSYLDISKENGQECNDFFDELEKHYTNH